ncbi:NADPH-dependent FMN reductase [Flexibacterium corallicola]|uniref:NADPH-dependent FMN reductase n=1 Tax=Flexibacterium corallicola TaxID=3037259 RepID=UPI00286EF07F|nr:NAD(P)H-dependent oxidoreductase [Pseudovibrio sp. M1P-2-3]
MKIIAFGASSSATSINKKLAGYAASLVEGGEVEVLDLNDFELPLFSEQREKELGQPELAKAFFEKIKGADAVIASFAEHNGSYSAAYKNLFDWVSRIDQKVFQDKPTVYLATSPGPGGAKSVLQAAVGSAPFFGVDLKASLSIPSFYDNFDMEAGSLRKGELDSQLQAAVQKLYSN